MISVTDIVHYSKVFRNLKNQKESCDLLKDKNLNELRKATTNYYSDYVHL